MSATFSTAAASQLRADSDRVLAACDVGMLRLLTVLAPQPDPIPVGDATDSDWAALEEAQREPLRQHNEEPLP